MTVDENDSGLITW